MTTLLQDLRLALRRLARTPAFAALAVLTLALAIGAHVAIFSLIDAVFLRPLPVRDPDRLVGVYESRDGAGFYPLSLPDYGDYRDATTVFSDLAAHYATAPLTLRIADGSEMVNGSVVSANYFSVLGVDPARGRFFLAEDDETPGAHAEAVVSYGLWQSRLGGRDDVLGTVVQVNGTAFTVVGVAPAGFAGVRLGLPSEIWIPTAMSRVGYRWCDAFDRDCTWIHMIGRLAPGRTIAEAETEMAVLSRRLRAAYPSAGDVVRGLSVAPLGNGHPGVRQRNLRLAGLLLLAVTLVVIVAGANLSGLLLARGLTRRKEVAVRLAMGASRRSVVALFLAETLLVALAGGAGALAVAGALAPLVSRFFPTDVPLELGANPTVLGYALLLSVATGLLVGVVPGIQASRPSLVPALKDVVTMGEKRRPKLLGLLLVVQVALSFVLLSATGLLARSLAGVSHPGGFDPASVATLRLRPRLLGYAPQQGQALSREVARRLERLPGVESVSLGARLPVWGGDAVPVGRPGDISGTAWIEEIGPRCFATFSVPLLSGRDFDERDTPESVAVAIVNRSLAAALWPAGEAVGQLLAIGERTYQVVGVVDDAAHLNGIQEPFPQAFTAYLQDPAFVDARIAVRATGDAARLLPAIRQIVRELDPAVPVTEISTMRDRLARFLTPVHLAGRVLGASGALALFLSAVGLFGVLALAVAQRTREIGIRMALGASRSHVVTLIVRDGMILVGVALGIGLVASLATSRSLAHYLYGVSPRDPVTYVTALLVLGLIAGLASWWPARRAAEVDPIVALRQT